MITHRSCDSCMSQPAYTIVAWAPCGWLQRALDVGRQWLTTGHASITLPLDVTLFSLFPKQPAVQLCTQHLAPGHTFVTGSMYRPSDSLASGTGVNLTCHTCVIRSVSRQWRCLTTSLTSFDWVSVRLCKGVGLKNTQTQHHRHARMQRTAGRHHQTP